MTTTLQQIEKEFWEKFEELNDEQYPTQEKFDAALRTAIREGIESVMPEEAWINDGVKRGFSSPDKLIAFKAGSRFAISEMRSRMEELLK